MADAALRALPSVERLVVALEAGGLLGAVPRRAATMCAREVVDRARQRLKREGGVATVDALVEEVAALIRRRFNGTLRRAVNATGIVLHTNLGRAPLSRAAQAAAAGAASGYSTLEIDLAEGSRGSRHAHVEGLLIAVTGAEAGFAVNNNASAVMLALAALGGGREVVVARGELVEIGGSFRMPDVMAQSGARLVEVGTTNRTYAADYESAITAATGLLLKVHRSNFTVQGFVHEVSLEDLVAVGGRHALPVAYDLGSGCLVDLRRAGLPVEPTVQAAVAGGVDLVLFSGDKMLGGPQAGILAGARAAVERCKKHPLARAVRLDKLDLAALAATLRAYLDPEVAWREIPILALLAASPVARRRKAARLARSIGRALGADASVDVVPTHGEMGGGSLPGVVIPSSAVAVRPATARAEDWIARLRAGPTPVIAVLREGAVLLDVLTLLPGDERLVLAAARGLSGG